MISIILYGLFVVVLNISDTDGRWFRVDYKYDARVNGWVKYHSNPACWTDAIVQCQLEGAVLISPSSKPLLNSMLAAMSQESSESVFTGVHSVQLYESIEGVSLSSFPVQWRVASSQTTDMDQNCLILLSNGTMTDCSCAALHPFICLRAKSCNLQEGNATCPSDYVYSDETRHCYKFHINGKTWPQALRACANEGGHLAIINSQAEANVLKHMYDNISRNVIDASIKDRALLGFREFAGAGDVQWLSTNGHTLSEEGFSSWKGGSEPTSRNYPCGGLYESGVLEDVWCDRTLPFICEKEAEYRDFDGPILF